MIGMSSSDLIKLEVTYLRSSRQKHIIAIFKLFFLNILLAHIFGSILLGMANLEPGNNWLTKGGIDAEIWWIQYLYAVYWGTTIMMTVGFGDFLPANHREVIITTFM